MSSIAERNMGFTTIFFAQLVGPSGKVIAFEPYPPNANDVRRNVLLNELTNVEVKQAAVGNYTGSAPFLAAFNGSLINKGSQQSLSVDVVRLDDALRSVQATLIKIDVEGHELEVLKGAAQILQTRPKLDIEVHPFAHEDRVAHCATIFEMLTQLEYALHMQPEIDAEILPLTPSPKTIEKLASSNVFHIFARHHGNCG